MKTKIVHFIVAQLSKPVSDRKVISIDMKKKAPDYDEYFPSYSILKKIDEDGISVVIKKFEKNMVVEIEKVANSDNLMDLIKAKNEIISLRAKFLKGFDIHPFTEDLTVYCFSDYDNVEDIVKRRKFFIFKLLKSQEEPIPNKIPDFEKNALQYSKNDMIFLDWDNVIIFDKGGDFDDEISILELANIRLLNLRIIERSLNEAVSFASLRKMNFFNIRRIMKTIYDKRMEIISNYETIENSLPLFGDWYTAKLYNRMCDILHVKDWNDRINDKLNNLEDVYELLSNRTTNAYMIILEASIVALIFFEILVTFFIR